ncbi:MAG TPA: DNA-binding response regulator [Alphaproteobacteria bacterium]|nr:DNA-binding response regulator [Alphaproteobacteria bacterium]
MPKILIIDDDRKIRELLSQYLVSQGFEADAAESAIAAEHRLATEKYDLITLDIMMSGKNGVEFAKELREKGNKIPVIMLTAKTTIDNRIEGLESGADDYLAKPFDPKELYLRIKKLLERSGYQQKDSAKTVKFGEYEFNLENLRLRKGEERIFLSTTEAELLKVFCANINKPIDRTELAKRFHGISERSVDVQITRLRKKIEPNPKEPIYLQTSWGEGYVLRV